MWKLYFFAVFFYVIERKSISHSMNLLLDVRFCYENHKKNRPVIHWIFRIKRKQCNANVDIIILIVIGSVSGSLFFGLDDTMRQV